MRVTPLNSLTRTRRVALFRPRLAFLGLGWIGRHRMQAIIDSGLGDVVALADPSPEALAAAHELAPEAVICGGLEELLAEGPDGVVIATPSAMHAAQSVTCLRAGAAVFCQKPLGRTRDEAEIVVQAAREANLLLQVDLCYRRTAAMQAVRSAVASGELGHIFAADLVFHNAYGPDKPWFYDVAQSGGGCIMDLGVHLVDAALWILDFPKIEGVEAHLFRQGARLLSGREAVEDYAVVTLDLDIGAVVRLACSWGLQAGRDAVISADFYGTAGGACFFNESGSFYDFAAHRHIGTATRPLAEPPDDWGGRTAVHWAERLTAGAGFEPEATRMVTLAEVLDRIYASA